jgi:hypothetical protein
VGEESTMNYTPPNNPNHPKVVDDFTDYGIALLGALARIRRYARMGRTTHCRPSPALRLAARMVCEFGNANISEQHDRIEVVLTEPGQGGVYQ